MRRLHQALVSLLPTCRLSSTAITALLTIFNPDPKNTVVVDSTFVNVKDRDNLKRKKFRPLRDSHKTLMLPIHVYAEYLTLTDLLELTRRHRKNNHWTLVVLSLANHTATLFDLLQNPKTIDLLQRTVEHFWQNPCLRTTAAALQINASEALQQNNGFDCGLLCLVFGILHLQDYRPEHVGSVPWRRPFLAVLGHLLSSDSSISIGDFNAWQPGVSCHWKPIETKDVSSLKVAIGQALSSANTRLKEAEDSLNQLHYVGEMLRLPINTMSGEVDWAKEKMANINTRLKSIDDDGPWMIQSNGRPFSDILHGQIESRLDHPYLRAARYAATTVEADIQCVEALKESALKGIAGVREELRAVLDESL